MTKPEHLRFLEKLLLTIIDDKQPLSKMLLRLLLAMLAQRTVSLPWLAQSLNPKAKPESNQTAIRRFFDDRRFDTPWLLPLLGSLLPPGRWILAIDRTNWKWGKTSLNLLVLAAVFRGCAVPLLWVSLGREGNSDTAQRIRVMNDFIRFFGKERIEYVTGDREFIGRDWISFLKERDVSFRFRLRRCDIASDEQDRQWEVESLFRRTNRCKKGVYLLWGVPVYLGGKPLKGGDILVIASNEPGDLLFDYRRRWEIECLFQALKGRGFDLECTRIVQGHRLCALMGVLALVYVLCVLAGEKVKERVCPATGRLRKSQFRRGLEILHRVAVMILAWQSWGNQLQFKRQQGFILGEIQ